MANDERDSRDERTVFQPGAPPPHMQQTVPPQTMTPRTQSPQSFVPREARIQVGDVLNHIFEVKRFLARGGMGEVFEGINVSSEERVAIKVMLPALAADPSVEAMFRKEARTLTRLNHPALVQYRVLAKEPELGVLYIVTEFIDGTNLSDVLRTTRATPGELRALTRRLADGLRVAHSLGAIHRDISPDNVLLESGMLDRARIIDFGIAKDLDPSTKTIVGDGFAGKLGYVAPEQLGDFGRDVGPWSDVYSLGLVVLAVIQGRDVDMGATLVDAVDRRRQGPDLSLVPAEMRPVLEKMLVANPAERFRSMDEVIAALDGKPVGATVPPRAAAPIPTAAAPAAEPGAPKSKTGLIVGGAIAALAVIGGGGYALLSGGGEHKPATEQAAAGAPVDTSAPPAERARTALSGVLPTISCSWLNVDRIGEQGGAVTIAASGVARETAAAQGALSRALGTAGLSNASLDFEQVLPVEDQACAVLDALRSVRDSSSAELTVQQPKFELTKDATGELSTDAVVTIDVGSTGEFAIFGIEPTGKVEALSSTRAEFERYANDPRYGWVKSGGTSYRIPLHTTHAGLSGLFLIKAGAPIDASLLTEPAAARAADWTTRFSSEAAKGGWKAQMVWYRTVDEVPG